MVYGELFTDLDKVRLLLEHISGLSDFKYKIEFTRNGKRFAASKKDDTDTEATEDDLLVAIPNDVLGIQAFYNILENNIRNTAKHSSPKPDITIFTINFIDDIKKAGLENADNKKEIENTLNEFIAVEIYDNIPIEKPDEILDLTNDDIDEFTEKKTSAPKDNKFPSYIEKLVFMQNKKLNEDILDNNKLRSSSLGLVEMDASAAYLRKRPVEHINHKSYDIQYDESWTRDTEKNRENNQDHIALRGTNCRHFLKAFKKENISAEFTIVENGKSITSTKKGNALGYRFFLHRPALVLVVTEDLKDDKTKKDELKKEGIWVVTPIAFETELKADESNKKTGKVYPHEFVLIDSSVKLKKVKVEHPLRQKTDKKQKITNTEEIDFLNYYKTSLPIRVLEVEQDQLIDNLFKKEAEKDANGKIAKTILDAWEKWCWERWFGKLENVNKCVSEVHNNKHIKKEENKVRFYTIGNTYKDSVCHSIVLFDHLYNKDGSPDITAQAKWCEVEKNEGHAEALSSLAQTKLPNYYKIISQNCTAKEGDKEKLQCYMRSIDKITEQKIVEMALSKVIVIDERIQEAAENKDFMKIKLKRFYKKMNVIIPEKNDINLSSNSYDTTLICKLKKYLGLNIENNEQCNEISSITDGLKDKDFVLIHYSIFERMFKKEEINGKIEEIVNKGTNVVITSGRGIPDNLTQKARFVNLSSVINAFVDVRSKYVINYLLNSSRKSNKI